MEVAVGFGRETGMNLRIFAFGGVRGDDVADEVRRARRFDCGGGRTGSGTGSGFGHKKAIGSRNGLRAASYLGLSCGNRMTSRILSWPSSIMQRRSMPRPMPP